MQLTDRWTDDWMDRQTDRLIKEQIYRWTDGCVDIQVYGRRDGRAVRQVDIDAQFSKRAKLN